MTRALRFESEASLVHALGAALIPPDVAARSTRFARIPGERGVPALVVEAAGLDAKSKAALAALGVRAAELPEATERAPFWPAIVRPEKTAVTYGTVLFVDRREGGGLELAVELLKKGSELVEVAAFEGGVLLRARRPSHYVVERCLEEASRVAAYAPVSDANDAVWVALGFTHRAMRGVRPATGEIVLVAGGGEVETIRPGRFQPVWDHLELTLAEARSPSPPVALPKRRVALSLARAVAPKDPTLWIIRESAHRVLDELAESAPEELLRSLRFVAWGDAAAPSVALLAATPTPFYPAGEAYAAHPELADVYLPADRRLHPPVWADRLRAVVGGPDERLRWLAQKSDGTVIVESVSVRDFAPLVDWVELAADTSTIEPWVRAVCFEPRAFEVLEGEPEPAAVPTPRAEEPSAPVPAKPRRATRVAPAPVAPVVVPSLSAQTSRAAPQAELREVDDADRALVELEASVAASDAPLADPSRDLEWLELARRYDRARLHRDASVCRARLVFGRSALAGAAVTDWLASRPREERHRPQAAASSVDADTLSTLVGDVVAASLGLTPPLPEEVLLRSFELLERAGDLLCVRSLWIGMRAIATASGGDELLLARARDRAFARLERGLSLSRDLPRAVRRAEGPAAEARRQALVDLLGFLERQPRTRSPVEAPASLTLSYVRLVFAVGLARAGDAAGAERLAAVARAEIPTDDAVHATLVAWLSARLAHALEGEPESAALPPSVLKHYEGLDRLQQYKVDRVRQCVKTMDPETDLDPFRTFGLARGDAKLALVQAVLGAARGAEKARVVDEAWRAAEGAEAGLEESVSAVVAALGACPARIAAPRLAQLGTLVSRADADVALRILVRALPLAERFETSEVTDGVVATCAERLSALPADKQTEIALRLADGARSLRHHEAKRVLSSALQALRKRIGGGDARSAGARLALSGALHLLGAEPGEEAIFTAERAVLGRRLSPVERLGLVRALAAYAAAISRLDLVAALTSEWAGTTDSYNTNTHLCLSAVELSDALASALCPHRGDGVSRARRLADDDERAVRAELIEDT